MAVVGIDLGTQSLKAVVVDDDLRLRGEESVPYQPVFPAPGWADFRTPIRRLYFAGSATHGGGGVTAIPAMQVVKQIVADG